MTDTLKRSPLHSIHEDAGARFTDFAGWLMPVSYSSQLAEHRAVRTAAGLFDLSHMGEIAVTGPDAARFVDHAFCNTLSTMTAGQAKYTLVLTESGGVIDDLVIYRLDEERYLAVANAVNRDADLAALTERAAGLDVAVTDVSDQTALLAVQGPAAADILAATPGFGLDAELAQVGNYRTTTGSFAGTPVLVARTGYTGEDGFELYLAPEHAPRLWSALLDGGAPHGLVPAGLASRDTLRLEAGMGLYGHELTDSTLPTQAGLGALAGVKKPEYVGRDAIAAGPPEGAWRLTGLTGEGRRAAREGYPIYADDAADAAPIGRVTSGALSPTLEHPIALAYVDPAHREPETTLQVDIRGRLLPFTVTQPPFYRRK